MQLWNRSSNDGIKRKKRKSSIVILDSDSPPINTDKRGWGDREGDAKNTHGKNFEIGLKIDEKIEKSDIQK